MKNLKGYCTMNTPNTYAELLRLGYTPYSIGTEREEWLTIGTRINDMIFQGGAVDKNRQVYLLNGKFIDIHPDDEIKICQQNQVKNTKSTHYNLWLDFETIDLIKNTLTKEEYIGALKFNILKYRTRNKGQDEADNEKVADYQRELNQILKEIK